MITCRKPTEDMTHSPSIPVENDADDVVVDVTEDDARDHIKALTELEVGENERLQVVDTLCRAFYTVRTGLSSHPDIPAVRVRLSSREALVLSTSHAARAQQHHREDRHGSARVGEEHGAGLIEALLSTPKKLAEEIHE